VQDPVDGALRRHPHGLTSPGSGLVEHLQPDTPRTPLRMLTAHLRDRGLDSPVDLLWRRVRAVRPVRQPGELPGQVLGHPLVNRQNRLEHCPRAGTFSHNLGVHECRNSGCNADPIAPYRLAT